MQQISSTGTYANTQLQCCSPQQEHKGQWGPAGQGRAAPAPHVPWGHRRPGRFQLIHKALNDKQAGTEKIQTHPAL